MSNLAHIVETAVLLGIAYGAGAVIGFVLRRLTAAWRGRGNQSAAVPGTAQGRASNEDKAPSDASSSTSAPVAAGVSAAERSEPERPAVAVPRLPARSVGSLFGSIEADLAGEAVIADTDARLALPGLQTVAPVPTTAPSAVEQLLAELALERQAPAEPVMEAVESTVEQVAAVQAEAETVSVTPEDAEPLVTAEIAISPADAQEQSLAHEDDELAAMHAVEGTAPPRRRRQG